MRRTCLPFVLVAAAALTGCAAKLQIIDRNTGQVHQGETIGSASRGSGEAQAVIDGTPYRGPWIYSAKGGSYSLITGTTSATAFSGGRMATATGTGMAQAFNIPAQGSGLITLRADDSQFIRCVFDFNEWTNTGIGQCQRNDGRAYDLAIRR